MKTLVLLALTAVLGLAQTAPALKGHYERVKVHGVSLEGNLEGDSPDRDVSVYLPPSYATNPTRRYPVLYILHGFTDTDAKWFGLTKHFINVPVSMEADLEKGTAREMILVMPDAYTRYAGSFYGSSLATGDWETFVANELVAYVDSHYRTLAVPASRGLAGHSMGGYGTIRLAMKHPGVYSSIYALSACCLNQDALNMSGGEKAQAIQSVEEFNKADFGTKAMISVAAAWSANSKGPLFFALPVQDGKPQPQVIAQWTANMPVAMVGQYAAGLKKLRAFAMDIGLQDGLLPGNQLINRVLSEHSISHTFETYEGNHVNKIAERMETKVFPFFSKNLKFE